MRIFAFKPKEYSAATVNIQDCPKQKKTAIKKHAEILPAVSEDALRRTTLHRAVIKNDIKWLRLISSKKNDDELLIKDAYGWAPVHYAAEIGNLYCLLEGRGSKSKFLQIINEDGDTPLHLLARNKKFNPNIIAGLSGQDLEQICQIENKNKETILDLYWHGVGVKTLKLFLQRLSKESKLQQKYAFALGN